jgi:predicted nucleotidyltransferase component of viral defense system
MKKVNIAASIRQRLLNLAKERNEDFNYVLTQYAMQRLLYRLSISEFKDRFLLKGALLFSIWNTDLHRPTRDADFLSFGASDVDGLVATFKQICALAGDVDDGLVFDINSIQGIEIKEDAIYPGVRITGNAELAKARIPFQADIGFGDVVTPEPEEASLPSYLDLPAPKLKIYPIYTVVAEKFQAMVALGMANSRMKDFHDIWLLSCQFDFDGETLAAAIKKTFANRDTQIPERPMAFTDEFTKDAQKQTQWKAFIRKSKLENIPEDLSEICSSIQNFLQPVIDALLNDRQLKKVWQVGGEWS